MTPDYPQTQDLVLIGGGHTHALVLRKWGMAPLAGARVTLINPGATAPYTGMLPGHVAGHYTQDELLIDLVRLARFAGARIITAPATGIDLQAREVHVEGHPPVAYDVLSVDVGITSTMAELQGFTEHAIAAKPLGPYSLRWEAFLAEPGDHNVAVLGGGVAGVELALAMAFRLRQTGLTGEVTVIDAGRALAPLPERSRAALLSALSAAEIALVENTAPVAVTAEAVALADGRSVPANLTVGAAGARPHEWLAETGLALDQGFITVGPTLASETDPRVFATGDCAHLRDTPRPKAGVYAVRAAPVLFDNLRASLTGAPLRPFKPQGDYLKLVSLGDRRALASKWGLMVGGAWSWRLKDRIDRAFMEQFATYPEMPRPAPPETASRDLHALMAQAPLCGGCGSKVGPETLRAALARLPAPKRADLRSAPGDDAAILEVGGATQVITSDHLRAFTQDPVLMARIAAVHAMGDIWAMGAAPQAVLATLILPRMAERLQARTLEEILTAAGEVFAEAGAEIVGGHTTQGAEMTIGFTVTGLAERPPIQLAGARPGDALLLTKPIGTGVLLAGEMALAARGEDVVHVLREMTRPSSAAASCLAEAHAMTDVTGFGLAGHLAAMAEASKLRARLDLEGVPLYPGALDLAERGIRSTLFPANRAAVPLAAEGPRAELLYDPQTSGGLLAALAPEAAELVLQALTGTGYTASIIGCFEEGPPGLTLA